MCCNANQRVVKEENDKNKDIPDRGKKRRKSSIRWIFFAGFLYFSITVHEKN